MAALDDPRTKFGLSCPSGGDFYICADAPTRFIGCCGIDPCSDALGGDCPRDQLFDASFSASSGDDFLGQACGASAPGSVTPGGHNRGGGYGLWYTCSKTRPPFLGCCSNDPCNLQGCLDGNLVPAVLSGDSRNASLFELPKTTSSTSPALSTATSNTGEGGDSAKLEVGPIIGITLAGVVVLLLLVGSYLWVRRRERKYMTLERQREQGRGYRSSKGTGGVQGLNEGMYEEFEHGTHSFAPYWRY
ncbi:hypothetical protein F5Y14DRAFT_407244, partial [Nemania sp. NC0429]